MEYDRLVWFGYSGEAPLACGTASRCHTISSLAAISISTRGSTSTTFPLQGSLNPARQPATATDRQRHKGGQGSVVPQKARRAVRSAGHVSRATGSDDPRAAEDLPALMESSRRYPRSRGRAVIDAAGTLSSGDVQLRNHPVVAPLDRGISAIVPADRPPFARPEAALPRNRSRPTINRRCRARP